MSRIFISYRRSDSISESGRAYDYLENYFGRDSVFKDVDSIDGGEDFHEEIKTAVEQCEVLLAIIGKRWLHTRDSEGRKRLERPDDWVKLEIETALNKGIKVIPVLLSDAEMPNVEMLPMSLKALVRCNAVQLRYDPDFRRDMERIVGVIKRHLDRSSESKASKFQKNDNRFQFEVATVDNTGNVVRITKKNAKYRQEIIDGDIAIDLVVVPDGSFTMGSPRSEGQITARSERPQHDVSVRSFLLSKYPVTQIQWRAVAALPSVERDIADNPSHFKGENLPVESISWYDAVEFCNRLSLHTNASYRLPSESEWEYACRAGTTSRYHFGMSLPPLFANYGRFHGSDNRESETNKVDDFPFANAFGIYDMHGNVYEWCADTWHEDYGSFVSINHDNAFISWLNPFFLGIDYGNSLSVKAPIDGSAWIGYGSEKVVRGGSWRADDRSCRCAYRHGAKGEFKSFDFGFRIACNRT